VLRGWREPSGVVVRIDPASLPGVDFLEAEVLGIDPGGRAVHTTEGRLAYDALVLALGSELDTDATPGLAEALESGLAHECYSLAGAEALHRRLTAAERGRVVFAVAGVPFKCPAAPFEAALLAADLLRTEKPDAVFQVDTFTPDPLPMPVAGPMVGEGLVAMLKQHEIGFYGGHALESVDGERGEVTFTDQDRVAYDVLAVVPRHRPPAVVRELGLSPAGWVPVDARTLTTTVDDVWAVGDVTALTLPNGKPLPKAAVFADGEAEVVANGIARHLGQPAPQPYYEGFGSCYIEIGGHVAAKGEGRFLEEPAPVVALEEPSPAFHAEKRDQESDWLRRWSTPATARRE
jgi:sulfide:quinone oxidoreductase